MSHRTEILEPACGGAPVPVVLSPEPFARGVRMVEAPAGVTVLQVLKAAVEAGDLDPADLGRTEVYIDGERLPRESALEVRLAEGQVVNVVVEPLGGGGGRRKDVGQVILQIAVIALAAWAGGAAGAAAAEAGMKAWAVYAAQAATTAAVMTVGNLAISALYSPESQGGRANDRYALQRASNRYRPWECFPLALGQVWAAPDLVAKTYTRNVGDEVWIHGILGLHYGPCEISDLKIGDTLVSSMGAGEARFAYHLTPGPRTFTIYPNDADQQDFTEELDKSGATVVRALGSEAEAFEIDVFLPEGLYFQKDDGRAIAADVTVTVRYRPVDEHGQPTGTGAWTAAPYPQARDSDGVIQPAGSFYLRNTTKEPWRVTRGFALPLGRYEFEVRRQPPDDGNEKRRDRILLTAIRGFAYRKPVADETLSIIEFAIKASALHQGTLAPITCRLTPVCPVWNGEDWSVEQATSNPAALLRWLATGPAPAKPLQPVQADAGLRAWYDLCEEYDWRAGVYLLEPRSQAEAFGLLEKAGRAGVFWDGSQLVASPWLDKPAPVQLFAGANLRDHTFSLAFPEPVHALRVEFQNLEQAGEPDELVVYNDGYGPVAKPEADPPVLAATLVEAFRLDGQRTLERAYRDGRWELARRLHQRRVDTWTCDVEHIACRLGDRVRLSWWAIEDGASARVRCRLWSGALVAGLRLDQPVEMVEGQSYAVDLRVKDQLIQGVAVVTTPGLTRVLTFAAPRAAADCPARGDLVAFGRAAKVAEDVEVIAIEPAEDLSARLVGVRWVAPYLLEAETGPIPPLESRLTGERRSRPPAPTLLGVQGDPAGVRVTFAMPPWRGSPITGFAARWRLTPPDPLEGDAQDGGWSDLPALAATAMHLVTPPPRVLPAPAGDPEYAPRVDVEVVALAMDGQASEPLLVGGVLVREDPFPPQDFAVEPAVRTAEDGSSFGVLAVSALPLVAAAAVDLIVEARENPEDGEPGPWKPAGPPLRSSNPAGDILGLTAGLRYGLRARWRSAAGWDSDWTGEVFGTVPAGSNVSYDVSPTSPTRQDIDALFVDVDDLIATYGDTASAAASASAASAAASAADTARALTEQALADAETAMAAAQDARDAAQAAQGAAQGAAGDAVAAATAAGGSAAAAAGHASEASSAADAAAGWASAAAGSATAASTSAGSASTSAGQAATSATNAAGSASSAASSASVAATAAGTATLRLAAMFPPRLDATASAFGSADSGAPEAQPAVPGANIENVAGFGYAFLAPSSTSASFPTIITRQVVPATIGRVYEVTFEVELVSAAEGAVASPYVFATSLKGDYTHTDASPWASVSFAAQPLSVGEIRTVKVRFAGQTTTGATTWADPASAVWLRFSARCSRSGGASSWRIRSLTVADVTSQAASEASAAASATSASTAAASATTAGQQASAAQTSATAASTSAGSASTSAGQAATSATNAAGSASSAASSASVAATAAGTATLRLAAMFPPRLDATASAFGFDDSGAPEAQPAVSGVNIENVAGFGYAFLAPSSTSASFPTIITRQVVPATIGRVYEVTFEVELVSAAEGAVASPYVFATSLKGDYTHTDASPWASVSFAAQPLSVGEIRTVKVRFAGQTTTGATTWADPASAVWLRFSARCSRSGGASSWRIRSLTVADVTSQAASEASAAASATSASTAAASATTAGQQASAAQTAATAASTSAGSASTSAGNAATSATNAAGSASSAASSASVAATAAGTATLRLAAMFPPRLDATASAFGSSDSGAPEAQAAVSGVNIENVAGFGYAFLAPSSTSASFPTIITRQVVPATIGRVYEVTFEVELVSAAEGAVASPYVFATSLKGDYTHTDASPWASVSFAAQPLSVGEIRTVKVRFAGQTTTGATTWADPASAVWLRFSARCSRSGGASSWRIRSLTVADVTSQAASEASAAASATSASTAAASATAAGESAATATTQANNASTSAGSASTSASQSAASASSAAGSASAAQAAMNIAASVGSLALNLNPVFADYPTTPGVPTGWSAWTGATPTRVGGQVSPYGLRVVGAAGAFAGIWQNGSPGLLAVRPGWYVLEADVTLDSGALTGAGLLFQARNEADSATQQSLLLSFATDKDITDAAPGAGTVGRTYRYRKLVQVTHADAARARFYVQAHHSDHGSTAAANAVIFHRAAVRAATSAEIAAQRADANATSAQASIDTLQTAVASNTSAIAALETDLSADIAGLSATVSIQAAAIADLEDNAAIASWQVVAVASGGNPARIGIVSSDLGADVVLDGDRVWFGPKTRFDVSANVYITDDAGVRTIQMGLFGASGNLIFWQGADSVAPGSATTANGTRAITRDGKAYVDGYRQQDIYREDATNVPGTTISTSWVDVLTMTIGAGPGVDDSFHVQVGLGIQTSPSRTRGSSSVQAPGGDWEVVEQDSSGTTGTERKIATGKWSTSIFGGGANPKYVSSITLGSPSSAEMAERSDISREWPFKFGSGGRLVVRMKADAGANLITPVVMLWSFVTRYT